MPGFWLEKTLWSQQRGFGSGLELLARTVWGWRGMGQRNPAKAFQEGTPHGSAEIYLLSILLPSHPKKSIQEGGGCKLKWLNIRG